MLQNKETNNNFTSNNYQNSNNVSKIINYYISPNQILFMNNPYYYPSLLNNSFQYLPSSLPYLFNGNSNNIALNQNSIQILNNLDIINNNFNLNNYTNIFQIQPSYNQFSGSGGNIKSNEKNKRTKQSSKLLEKKKNRGNENKYIKKNDNYKNNKTLNTTNFHINDEKSYIINSNQNDIIEKELIKNEKKTKQIHPLKEKIKTIKNENITNSLNKKNNINNKDRKIKRNIKIYKELLQDTLLQHLDEEKKDICIIINNNEFKEAKKEKSKKMKNNYTIKEKINNLKTQKTKCIFHGNNYEKTNSIFDFMKYNYKSIEDIKKPKKIYNPEMQTVNINPNIYSNNFEDNKYNIYEIQLIKEIIY